MSSSFAVLIAITVVRQIPHLLLELRNRRARPRYTGDRLGACVFYSTYLGVWGATAYYLWHGGAGTPFFFAGTAILVSGVLLRFLGLRELDGFYTATITIQEDHQLIESGVYGIVRHPLHLALLMELLGMALTTGQAPLLIACAAFCPLVLQRNRREDAVLRSHFGAEAVAYQQRVPSMDLVTGVVRACRRKGEHVVSPKNWEGNALAVREPVRSGPRRTDTRLT